MAMNSPGSSESAGTPSGTPSGSPHTPSTPLSPASSIVWEKASIAVASFQ